MDKELVELFIELGVTIAAFLVGRYVLPKIKSNINIQDLTAQFQLLLSYAESFVAYARQFMTELSGKEKMDSVVEKLKTICDQQGIEVDEDTLRAIGQKAYDAMVAGEKSSKVILEDAMKEIKAVVEPTVKEIVTETTGAIIEKITTEQVVASIPTVRVVEPVDNDDSTLLSSTEAQLQNAVGDLIFFSEDTLPVENITNSEPKVDTLKDE